MYNKRNIHISTKLRTKLQNDVHKKKIDANLRNCSKTDKQFKG